MIDTADYPEDFDSWLNRVSMNDAVMFLLYQIYQLDMIGKVNKENMIVSLKVSKARKPLTDDDLNKFSDFMASGALDIYLEHRRNKHS